MEQPELLIADAPDARRRFWRIFAAVLVFDWYLWMLVPQPFKFHPEPGLVAARLFAAGVLVALAWAVCFRRQVQCLRVSKFALLALLVMEIVLVLTAE